MLFFGASKIGGGSIFDPSLAKRNGSYPQYYNGDIQTFHISYYRRGLLTERNFHTANLRKSPGFYLVAQGGDPLPDVEDVQGNFYNVTIVKNEGGVQFGINGLTIFSYGDSESDNTGPKIQDGKIGFRQMAPFIAQYRNLQVYDLGNSSYY